MILSQSENYQRRVNVPMFGPITLRNISLAASLAFGVLGIVLTAVSLFLTLREPETRVTFEIISATDVLDLRRSLKDLRIEFRGQDLQEQDLNLKVVPKGYGGGVDTGDDGYGKANGPGPVPIDGVEGSGRWPRQWPGGGRQWRRPAKTARRHAGSGTGGLGWHEFAGQPLGLSGGRVGRRRRAVRLVGEWRAIGPGRN